MVAPVLSVVGVVLIALAFWWRRRPRSGRRWWSGGGRKESAALVAAPGIGLALALVWPAALVTEGQEWYITAAVPVVIGVIAALWPLLNLPTPNGVRPKWRRGQVLAQKRAEQRARRRQQGAQRPAPRGGTGRPGGPKRGR
ncbi:hypothetical protein [Actinotalea sp. Marseille-Q4924]|uniref:hypothetical protein n=1 Tax=Actinotalea sp. Marseille-Q4924 TaxID=2866571 RepID=UPI001CE42131|nr:hypothetical protein [Actinotalea sp. Marseille-Q4924]